MQWSSTAVDGESKEDSYDIPLDLAPHPIESMAELVVCPFCIACLRGLGGLLSSDGSFLIVVLLSDRSDCADVVGLQQL